MESALHLAAERNDIKGVLAMLDQGADVHEIGSNQWPLIVRAAAYGHTHLVEKLLERGADRIAKRSGGDNGNEGSGF